jgi:aspartyl-tRNA synthetase
MRAELGLKDGDAVFFVCGVPAKIAAFAGQARDRIGAELGPTRTDRFEFCWIVDYPMFEWDEEEKAIGFSHNPFSMPQGGLGALETMDPLEVLAHQYDLVCNGVELSSGAIRNHKPEIMEKAFAIAGYDRSVLEEKFAGMYRAFKAGAPPHGGIAPGIDRIVMLLARVGNLREVTMFPMTQTAEDLMMGAPSEATARQLAELHIQLSRPAAKRP